MSLPAQNPKQQVVATAGQTVIPFTFRCDDSTLIHAWVADDEQGGFAVALNADQTADPGGTITLTTPCAADDVVTVERVSNETQTVALTAYGAFPASSITSALDRLVMLLQELSALLTRAFRVSRANIPKMDTMDFPAPEAGKMLGWEAVGDGTFRIVNFTLTEATTAVVEVFGEELGFTGMVYNFAHTPVTIRGLYRNGQRIFLNDDYTIDVDNHVHMLVALVAGEKINADYSY